LARPCSRGYSHLRSAYALIELATGAAITRTLAREFLRAFIYVELGAQALVRKIHRPRFVIMGQCHRRGVCCTQIILRPPQLFHQSPAAASPRPGLPSDRPQI